MDGEIQHIRSLYLSLVVLIGKCGNFVPKFYDLYKFSMNCPVEEWTIHPNLLWNGQILPKHLRAYLLKPNRFQFRFGRFRETEKMVSSKQKPVSTAL